VGERLAAALRAGDVIVLEGPLGAGKTRLVAGIARGLGVGGRVKSPTFTLVHEHPGALTLFHADFYRLSPPETGDLGLDELLERGVLVAEWGDRMPGALRAGALAIAIAVDGERERTLTASATGGRGLELLEAFRRATEEAR